MEKHSKRKLRETMPVVDTGQSIQNGPSKICGRQPLYNFTWSILEYLDPFAHD